LLHEQGQFETGRKLVEQVVADAPDNAEAHFTLGNIHAEQGSETLAIEEFHQTLCLDPHHIEAYYSIVRFFLAQNNLIDSERVMKLGVSHNPDSLAMGLFYNSLKSVLDKQEQESVLKIIQQLEEGFNPDNVQQIDISQQNMATQLRYFDLRLKLLQRQRPYLLSCSEIEENPFFERQIGQTQAKIEAIKQLLTASE
jgi:tetratricopeptide (TPR) repeat protein